MFFLALAIIAAALIVAAAIRELARALNPVVEVFGTVTDTDGNPIEGAEVTFEEI